MALIRAGMDGNTIGARCNAESGKFTDRGVIGVARVANQGDLVEIDTKSDHR